ncbi:hypothetical protein BZG36_00534 [Bifiguratus adelaidae]|uniref:trimethyllysine dioxygenase n=1 Tax=Bifiguratus adelaidae TaxID=1938954 RepID=A0A261Y777_9FUNG|nr:hypothetical protein BZG36_00534 [Bifiguratus adelaidae]
MAARVLTVSQHDGYLRVQFAENNEHADYHYFWLRHNCPCLNGCRHPDTRERVIDSIDVPIDIEPVSVQANANCITIHWPGEATPNGEGERHVSTFEASWLREHAYALNRVQAKAIAADVDRITLDYNDYVKQYGDSTGQLSEEGLHRYRVDCGLRLKVYGLVVVRNRGDDTEAIIADFITKDGEPIPTHFGRIEDLRTDNTTNDNTDQLGYTTAGVDLPPDQPFIQAPPPFQFLQCMRPADQGGDSYLADAFAVAEYIRNEKSTRAYGLLTTVPITFHRKQAKFESKVVAPLLTLSAHGAPQQIRYSYFSQAAHHLSFADMTEFYDAYNLFTKTIRDPRNQYRFALNTGDIVLYDNYRMVHARTPFIGSRWVRGVYLSKEDTWNTLLGSDLGY